MTEKSEQITLDHILQDAYSHKQPNLKHSNYKITDIEELNEYQSQIRSSYEKALQFKRTDLPQYIRYLKWEWELNNFLRARSIFERALAVEHSNVKVWFTYINLEITGGNVNHARNLLERLVLILPRVDKFYYEYIQLEEKLSNYSNCHAIFNRWLQWKPEDVKIYQNYIRFLVKYKDIEKLRGVYEKLVNLNPTVENFHLFLEFESKYGSNESVTVLFDLIIENLINVNQLLPSILVKYLDFTVKREKNLLKLKLIYKFGIEQGFQELLQNLTTLEKQYGSKDSVELNVLLKRKLKYENELEGDDYDLVAVWDYLDLLQKLDLPQLELYEKFLVNRPQPPSLTQDQLYMLWLRFLYFLELQVKDVVKCRSYYRVATKKFPQRAELWVKFAHFEIRQLDIGQLRKIFGYALAKLNQDGVIIQNYVDLEVSLRQFDRVRKIFESCLAKQPENIDLWFKFIDFEQSLEEFKRTEEIFYILVDLKPSDPAVFSKFLKFLHETLQFDKTRKLYLDTLSKIDIHKSKRKVHLYISYLLNELQIPSDEQLAQIESTSDSEQEAEFEISQSQILKLDSLFQEAIRTYKEVAAGKTEERVILFEAYKSFVKNYRPELLDSVIESGPKLVKHSINGKEELKFIFDLAPEVLKPDTTSDLASDPAPLAPLALSFLENARKWMMEQEGK